MFGKKKYKIPKFRDSVPARCRALCKLVDGGCDDEAIGCDECMFNDEDISHSRRREFKVIWDGLIKGGVK